MEQRNGFGRRGSGSPPSPPVIATSAKKKSNVALITVVAVVGFGLIGWIAKQVMPDQPTSPAEMAIAPAAPQAAPTFPPASVGKMWVTSDRLISRTCASVSCGVTGQHFFREVADVVEIQGEWGRISKYYDASCVGGKSQYVDQGNASCDAANGIVDGKLAEWVEVKFLSPTRPADPAEGATGLSKLIGGSDDFRTHEKAFVRAAQKLIASGECTEADFVEMGGFVKSFNDKGPVYFIYCGGMTAANRLYLNVSTGRTYR